MATFIDPFTQVTRWIIDALKNDTDITSIVAASNILDLTRGDAVKGQWIAPTDFPLLNLIPIGGAINLKATSTSGVIEQNFSLEVATAEEQLSDTSQTQSLFFPLKWALCKAMHRLIGGNAFKSDGLNFSLIRLDVADSDESFGDIERGQDGWFSVLQINTTLSIPESTLSES